MLFGKLRALFQGDAHKEIDHQEQVHQWMQEGFSKMQSGQTREAQICFEKILEIQPLNSDALYLCGVIHSDSNEFQPAIELISKAIAADSGVASYHLSLAKVCTQMGRSDAAYASYQKAVELDPQDPESRTGLGNALLERQQYREAYAHFAEALRMAPETALAHYNQAVACQALGMTQQALLGYKNALVRQPTLVQAAVNMGSVYFAERDYASAIRSFSQATQLQPAFALAWENLGVALQANRSLDEAYTCLQRAIVLNPASTNAHSNLALVLREQGRLQESLESSQRALAIRDSVGERIRMATLIPVIAPSAEAIAYWRNKLAAGLDDLLQSGGRIEDPLAEIGVCNFNLAYQPECNRALQEKSAAVYGAMSPSLHYTAAHCRQDGRRPGAQIKVGFISKFMFNHSIGRTTRGILANLSRDKFHVTALFVPPVVDDSISKFIQEQSDRHVFLPSRLQDARQAIADLELDILFYQDIGMDAYTYFLAYSRLAPVQCVSFGHPDTTGIPNMDYWVSSEHFEIDSAAGHYSEKLFLLRNIGTLAYYYRPELAMPAKTRQQFGLTEGKNIYLCPQALFKLHPDFDSILAGILRSDPNGELVLVEAPSAAWGEQLRARFAGAMPDLVDRIRFLPGMSPQDFLALIAAADVMLDTIYFNGMNTSLEAFAVGTPVVTMPTELQRGRHTFGMYQKMGVLDCVASSQQEYVGIAVGLGTDSSQRQAVKEKILANSAVLYEETEVVREFERFFEAVSSD